MPVTLPTLVRTAALALALSFAAPTEAAPQDPAPAPKKQEEAREGPKVDATKDRPSLDEYDLGKKNLALEGYDPVAYFPEGGGKPKEGSKKITTKYRGVVYRFVSEKNRTTFLANPERYEPAYGGWCAWAMADGKGSKTEPDPESFTIEDGRLYVFYDGFWGDTRKQWRKKGGAPKLKAKSDTNWKRMSGESPVPTDSERAKKKRQEEAAKKARKDAETPKEGGSGKGAARG